MTTRLRNSTVSRAWLAVCGFAVSLACLSVLAQTPDPAPRPGSAGPQGRGAGAAQGRSSTARPAPQTGRPIRILFLGQDADRPHNPAKMFPLLAAPMARRGIQLTYVSTPAEALTPARLGYH